jgi:hypothetical protein
VEQLVQHLAFDRDIVSLFFHQDVQSVYGAAVFLSYDQSEIVLVVELEENLVNQLFAQLVLLIVLEVGVEHEADAPLTDHVVTQVELGPVQVPVDVLQT